MGDVFEGFIPTGDRLHSMQGQRPGMFVGISEQGRIFEICVLMESQKVMVRQWEPAEWDQQAVDTEIARVDAELQRQQQLQAAMRNQQSGAAQQYGNRGPAGAPKIIKPGGPIPGTI